MCDGTLFFRKISKFNRWESASQFVNGLGYLDFTQMYYMGVIKFLKCALLYIRCFDRGHQLTPMNAQMDMPIYIISQSVHQQFSIMCIVYSLNRRWVCCVHTIFC